MTTKAQRRRAPFLLVVDEPSAPLPQDRYHWIEVPLPEVFKLDVSGKRSM